MSKTFNPFGVAQSAKSSIQILQESFGIGFRKFDFGAEKWDPNRIGRDGSVEPGWVPDRREQTVCVVEFSVNEGKGTGRQVIPASEFPQYVKALRKIIDTNYAEAAGEDRTQYITTYEHVSGSFRMVHPKVQRTQSDGSLRMVVDRSAERNVVSVRCTGGKGAKPMLVPRNEFESIVSALEGVSGKLDELVSTAQSNYEAELNDNSY